MRAPACQPTGDSAIARQAKTPAALFRFPLLAIAFAAAVPATASPIADHRALYELSLARTDHGSSIQGASGQMILEVKSSCQAVTVNQMFRSNFWGSDAMTRHSELRLSSQEARDGKSYSFSLRNEVDGALAEQFEGKAVQGRPGASGAISYARSAFANATLPAGAIFPSTHLRRLLAAADKGEGSLSVEVFDGAEKGKVYRAAAIIGRKDEHAGNVPHQLVKLPHWRVMISYFPLGSEDPAPEYESSFDLYPNGVSAGLVLDYGGFAVRADLVELRLLPGPTCR